MFQDLYKGHFNQLDRQENRRKELLQQQKLKRSKQQDEYRGIHELHRERKRSPFMKHKNNLMNIIQLQSSEWLKEKPDDLNQWLLVPCPKGQRCLVVAEKGKTKMYSKQKKYRMTFSSFLPGGNLNKSGSDYCILDCIFNQETDTFYVLDALYYAIPLIECDAEFRFFWIKSKFYELDILEEKSKFKDTKSFKLLENYDIADEETLSAILHKYPLWPENQPQLDGFLFYHKKSHYVFGVTPLVCWLFPFMLPDVLQLAVCSLYEPPAYYCNQNPLQYMDEFDKGIIRKKNTELNQIYVHHDSTIESLLEAEKMLGNDEVN